jgi:hypothetical protein
MEPVRIVCSNNCFFDIYIGIVINSDKKRFIPVMLYAFQNTHPGKREQDVCVMKTDRKVFFIGLGVL